jgi:hypothetical protein
LGNLVAVPSQLWKTQQWHQLSFVLSEINECVRLCVPPTCLDGDSRVGLARPLAALARRVLSRELCTVETDILAINSSAQLLTCLSNLLKIEVATSDARGLQIGIAAVDALDLAQQITAANLCPALADAVGNTAPLEAEQLPAIILYHRDSIVVTQRQADVMDSSVILLQLALAVALLWPGGILKSNAARCLAGAHIRHAWRHPFALWFPCKAAFADSRQ